MQWLQYAPHALKLTKSSLNINILEWFYFVLYAVMKNYRFLKGTYTTVISEKLVLEYMFHKGGKDFTLVFSSYKLLHLLDLTLVHKTSKEYYASINKR